MSTTTFDLVTQEIAAVDPTFDTRGGEPPVHVTPDMTFDADLGFDSLDLVSLVLAMEQRTGVEIPDDALLEFRTVQDLVHYIDTVKGRVHPCTSPTS